MESTNVSNVSGVKRKFDIEPNSCVADTNKCNCYPTKLCLVASCFNFLNSKVPCRVMFHNNGAWLDFPYPVTRILINGFKNGKSSVRFSIGNEPLLLDFLSMVVINLRTKKQRSVAWIDEVEKCFFPKNCGYDDDEGSHEWDFECLGNRLVRTEMRREPISPPEVIKHVMEGSGVPCAPRPRTASEILRVNLEALKRGSGHFDYVQKRFFLGMGPFASSSAIMSIHQYSPKDSTGLKKKETFEMLIKLTEAERGNANVCYAWFGTKKLDSLGVLIHGFGNYGKLSDGVLGTGLYLTPAERAFSSVNQCDVDEKGMQYLILCRVILGNMEQVHPGSKYCPSSREYDSGVDNLSSPKCYVVWPTHASTYIHPEYFVSFKLAPLAQEYLFGLKDTRFHGVAPNVVPGSSSLQLMITDPKKHPTSPWVPFSVLLEAIQGQVSPLTMELIQYHHQEFKRALITREELVNKVKAIIGDETLLSILRRCERNPSEWFEGPPVKRMKLEGSFTQQSNPDGNNPPNAPNNGPREPTAGPDNAI